MMNNLQLKTCAKSSHLDSSPNPASFSTKLMQNAKILQVVPYHDPAHPKIRRHQSFKLVTGSNPANCSVSAQLVLLRLQN